MGALLSLLRTIETGMARVSFRENEGRTSTGGSDDFFRFASLLDTIGERVLDASPKKTLADIPEPKQVTERGGSKCYTSIYSTSAARLGPSTAAQVATRSHLGGFSPEEIGQLRRAGYRVDVAGDRSVRIEGVNEEGTRISGEWIYNYRTRMHQTVVFQALHRWFGDPSYKPRSRAEVMVNLGGTGVISMKIKGAEFGYGSDVSSQPFIRAVTIKPWEAIGEARLLVRQG